MTEARRKSEVLLKIPFRQYGRSKGVLALFLIFMLLSLFSFVISAVKMQAEGTANSFVTLILLCVPAYIEYGCKEKFPPLIEAFFLILIFGHGILGEVFFFYIRFRFWDIFLHALSGFLAAFFGIALLDILNGSGEVKRKLNPLFTTLNAFSFASAAAVLWEFIEFSADRLLGLDMQKDTIVHSFRSVLLDSTNSNIPVAVNDIRSVYINGKPLLVTDGYLELGLYDTMEDLAAAAVGSLLFCAAAFICLKAADKSKLKASIIPERT